MNVTQFRSGLRRWLAGHDRPRGRSLDGQVAQLARVRRALYDAGWMRYGWPAATMTASSSRDLDSALTELSWPELLAEWPDVAIPMTFRLLGETGAQAHR